MKSQKTYFNRIPLVVSLIVLQVVWFVFLVVKLTEQAWWITILLQILSFIAVLVLINGKDNPAYKLAWTVPILAFPVFGGLLYLVLGGKKPARKLRKRMHDAWNGVSPALPENTEEIEKIGHIDTAVGGQVRYIGNSSGFPVYGRTLTKYYESGEAMYPDMLEALEKAERFIFLEFFIIAEGAMWDGILRILRQKAEAGLDIRVIYDDMGCFNRLPYRYGERLAQYGIRCEVFNPVVPLFTTVINHRDHRKILVVDGRTGFTGGINLADEYINRAGRSGYWKDAGIRLSGEAVYSLTAMFLTTWNSLARTNESLSDFKPSPYASGPFGEDGHVQPYADSPLDDEYVSENVYLNIIGMAERYVYLFTPYLVIDNEMLTALCLAGGRGVDVRIVTPGIPDKRMIFCATRSYYERLMEAGIRIYEFSPGFLHAKCSVCDDKIATVGTVNLDYRSLYLNFECGVYLFGTSSVASIREDFMETIRKSRLINDGPAARSLPVRFLQSIIRLFAPLL